MSTIMPRSALRHRPIHSEVQEWIIATPQTTHRKRTALHTNRLSSPFKALHPLALIGLSMLLTLLLLWAIQGIWTWSRVQLDTFRYGFPRTSQVDHAVGHGGKSHFIATNQDGQVYVMEIPEDDPARSQLLIGPHVQGKDADLAPVQLAFQGNPQHPDLLVEIQDIETRFHNLGNVYALSTTS